MIHYFPEETAFDGPNEFTDPFRYAPHPLVQTAASQLIERIDSDPTLSTAFSEGKMLGVLVCTSASNPKRLCHIDAFSGNVGGRSHIEGFVPPIYDLLTPDGVFKRIESEISALNNRIRAIEDSEDYAQAKSGLTDAQNRRDEETAIIRAAMAASRHRRDEIRRQCTDERVLARLVRESQTEKANLRRIKAAWEERADGIKARIERYAEEIDNLKRERTSMSEKLQKWIFKQYVVHNALGEEASIADIFADKGIVPPGGTGECAAPKLLEFAYRNGLKPLAMGEFWYGQSPATAVRTHGHFYPSCTSKCGPLLGFMTKGLQVGHIKDHTDIMGSPAVIYEDEYVIAAEKPGGMPSVPGLDGRKSLLEWLREHSADTPVYAVHRLDMDTSGVMVFARTREAETILKRQFEEHSIQKTYSAKLSPQDCTDRFHVREMLPLKQGDKGTISIPLSPDYDERPRQRVDYTHGKHAITEYEVTGVNPDDTTDIIFHPVTGRTHQLRVHSAHTCGLGRPIVGDMLYGGSAHGSLCLRAIELTFVHPKSDVRMTVRCLNPLSLQAISSQ